MATETCVRLAVVGHTNAGKTSLLRTLTRNRSFGEVSLRPATTRHVEAINLELGLGLTLEFDDTPGLEDSMGLLDALHNHSPDPREPGPTRLQRWLESPAATARFTQEAKALRQLLACDLALYVADAREPVTGKYQDEFVILNWAGKPCLVVLNFVADPQAKPAAWRAALQRAGLHNTTEFDTVVFDAEHESRLLRQLALLLPAAEAHFERLAALRREERLAQALAAASLIAEMLVDCAALRVRSDASEDVGLETLVRERERRLNRDLLALFRFAAEDYATRELPITGVEWAIDPFDPDALAEIGLSLGSSAAAGAAVGAALDLATGFTSLGAATLIGGAVGAGIDAATRIGKRVASELGTTTYACVEIRTLLFLARRATLLVNALVRRGHAATEPVTAQLRFEQPLPNEPAITKLLARCQRHPEWSALAPGMQIAAEDRIEITDALARLLHRSLASA